VQYCDHNSGPGVRFPDRKRSALVLTDDIDEEDGKYGEQNRTTVADKFLSNLPFGNPVGWGVKGQDADRKVIFEAEQQKLQNQIDEAKLKDPDLKVPEIHWKYAMRKGMFNLGHIEGLGANV
jgi:hypothetical protein